MENFLYALNQKYGINLDTQQRAAVTHKSGNALVIAGPGSGKTTVLMSRICFLVAGQDISPENILAMAFNKLAGEELKKRSKAVFGEVGCEKAFYSTIHGFCYQIVKSSGSTEIKLSVNGEGNRFLREAFYKVRKRYPSKEEINKLNTEVSVYKNKMFQNCTVSEISTEEFAKIYAEYEFLMERNSLLDFDDLQIQALNILSSKDNKLSEKVIKKYNNILVDEAQDLSPLQFEIIKTLWAGGRNNIFMVGDDDQCIYGFRGADPSIMAKVPKVLGNCSTYKLETNYRSSDSIVKAASKFIDINKNRYKKEHKSNNKLNVGINYVTVWDYKDQYMYITDKCAENERLKAVLYRNNISSVGLINHCIKTGTGFSLKGEEFDFFENWVIRDILNFLRFVSDRTNKEILKSLSGFLRKCMDMVGIKITGDEIYALAAKVKENSNVMQSLKNLKDEGLRLFFENLELEMDITAKMKPAKAIDFIDLNFQYTAGVKKYCAASGASFENLIDCFLLLKDIAGEMSTISEFLKRVEIIKDIYAKGYFGDNHDKLIFSTIHMTKGLEFETVFLPDLIDGIFPGRTACDALHKEKNEKPMEEERRIFFVAMTRAKQNLHLLSAVKKFGKHTQPSRFIKETTISKDAFLN